MISGYDLTDPANVASLTIAWNADNLPSRIVYTKGGTTTTVDFSYDGKGGRWKKAKQGGETNYYIGTHYEVKDGVATLYVFAGSTRIAKITGKGTLLTTFTLFS